jgi:hypothetical protein
MSCIYNPKSKAFILVKKKWSSNNKKIQTFLLDIIEHQSKQVIWKTKQKMSLAQVLDLESQEIR